MHGGSSISVIKNNRNLLKNTNRDKFFRIGGKSREVVKDKYDHLVLDTSITKRLRKENKKIFYKRLVTFVILFISLIVCVISLL